MSTPATPSEPNTSAEVTNVTPSFEDRVQMFWEKNSKAVLGAIVAVIVVILAYYGWEYVAEQRELSVQKDYAAASNTEQLSRFAAEHPGHTLAGAAQLRIADEAYAAARYTDALTAYEKALPALKGVALEGRAKLGLAMAKAGAGRSADAEKDLNALSSDAQESQSVRTEAAYQLAVLAAAASRADDVKKYSELVMSIDPTSPWTQRVMMLRMRFPGEAGAPGISLPGLND